MAAVVACPAPAFMSAETLDEVCAGSHDRVLQWRKDRAQCLQREAQRGLQDLQRDRAQLDDLQADLENAIELRDAAARLRAEGSKLGDVVRKSVKATAARAEAAAHERDKLCAEHQARRKELQEEEAVLASQEEAERGRAAEIERFLAMYADRLGLAITRVAPQTVKMSFTLIDQEDLGREFSFTLGLSNTTVYRVFDVTPEVPQLDALLTRLQRDASMPTALPAFVCAMRRAFQEAADRQAGVWL